MLAVRSISDIENLRKPFLSVLSTGLLFPPPPLLGLGTRLWSGRGKEDGEDSGLVPLSGVTNYFEILEILGMNEAVGSSDDPDSRRRKERQRDVNLEVDSRPGSPVTNCK